MLVGSTCGEAIDEEAGDAHAKRQQEDQEELAAQRPGVCSGDSDGLERGKGTHDCGVLSVLLSNAKFKGVKGCELG